MVETTGVKIGRQVIRVGRQKGGFEGKYVVHILHRDGET
jgi:hypothetical protein